jgi:light-regulated signal transduction histidine kinase (bacteriophytochrome)
VTDKWKKIQINCEAEPDLPLAWMDRVAFAAVMDNLLSKELTEKMDGTIWCESQAGHGASFFLRLRAVK